MPSSLSVVNDSILRFKPTALIFTYPLYRKKQYYPDRIPLVEKSAIVNEKIQDIAKVSAEQAHAIAEINVGIDQISSVVQNNSATAEESAAASEELSGQANMVKSMVAKFNLRKDGVSTPAFAQTPAATESFAFDSGFGDKY